MKRVLLIAYALLVFTLPVLAQTVKLEGCIQDEQGKGVGYASIQVLQLPDSTFIGGTLSREDGSFIVEISNLIPLNQAILKVSSIGFHSQIVPVNTEYTTVKLHTDDILLGEILVTAHGSGQQIDHRTFRFSPKALQSIKTGGELLRLIPDLHINAQTLEVTSISKGSVTLLINGIEATPSQLNSLQTEAVKEIIYYDIPPARYKSSGVVINIVAPLLNQGVNIGGNARRDFKGALHDGLFYLNLSRNNNQYSFEYNLYKRDYKKQEGIYRYVYPYYDEEREHTTTTHEVSGMAYHSPTIRFSHSGASQVFQTSFTSRWNYTYKDGDSEILFRRNSEAFKGKGTTYETMKYWSPLLDTYYSWNINDKQSLTTTLKLAYYNTCVDHLNTEFDLSSNKEVVNDKMLLKNKTYTLGGELVYSLDLRFGTLSSGYRVNSTKIDYDVENIYGQSRFTRSQTKHYAYTELSGSSGKTSYVGSLGLTYIDELNADETYKSLALRPEFIISHKLADNQLMRFEMWYKPFSASAELVSKNYTYLSRDILHKGNPNLKRADSYSFYLLYSLALNRFDLRVEPYYIYSYKPIYFAYDFIKSKNVYERYIGNADKEHEFGVSLQMNYKPFGDALALSLYVEPRQTNLVVNGSSYKHLSWIGSFSATFNKGGWFAQYSYRLADWQHMAGRLTRNYTSNDLLLKYQWKYWGISLEWSIIGAPARYEMDFLPYSAVKYYSDTYIFDFKNMFIVGVSFNFNKGKKQSIDRKIESSVSEAVVF